MSAKEPENDILHCKYF